MTKVEGQNPPKCGCLAADLEFQGAWKGVEGSWATAEPAWLASRETEGGCRPEASQGSTWQDRQGSVQKHQGRTGWG